MRLRVESVILACLAAICCLTSVALPETYRGIGYLDTLGELRSTFPGASFEKQTPAWATTSDAMYKITGAGLSGTIIVKMSDPRPATALMAATTTDDSLKGEYDRIVAEDDDAALEVDWVRWVPAEPLPLQRFVLKYGNPDKPGFSDDDMTPFRTWNRRGLSAYLDDTQRLVRRVDFSFTSSEIAAGMKKRYGIDPSYWHHSATIRRRRPARHP